MYTTKEANGHLSGVAIYPSITFWISTQVAYPLKGGYNEVPKGSRLSIDMAESQQSKIPPSNTGRKILLSCVTFAVVAGITLSVLAIIAAIFLYQGTLP